MIALNVFDLFKKKKKKKDNTESSSKQATNNRKSVPQNNSSNAIAPINRSTPNNQMTMSVNRNAGESPASRILTGGSSISNNPFSIENIQAQQKAKKEAEELKKKVEEEKKQAGVQSQTELQKSALENKFANQFTGNKEKDIKQIVNEAKQNKAKEKEVEKKSKTYQQYKQVQQKVNKFEEQKKNAQKQVVADLVNRGKQKVINTTLDTMEKMPGSQIGMLRRAYEKGVRGEKVTPSDILLGSNILSTTVDEARRRNEDRLNNADDTETTMALKQHQYELNQKLIKARNNKSKNYDNILKEYNQVTDQLQSEQAKLLKKQKGIVGALEKGVDTFTGGLDSSVSGMDSSVDKLFGVKSDKRLGATEVLSNQAMQDTKNKAGKIALETSHSIGAMVPTLIGGLASGGVSTAVSFGTYGGSAYNQAKRDGYTDEQATRYGVVNGGLEAMLNKILPSFKFGGKNVYGKTATDKFTKKIMTKTIGNESFKRLITDASGEFTEEYLQEFLDPIVRETLLEEDNGVGIIKGKKADEIAKNIASYTANNFFSKENLRAGAMGALTSGIMGTHSAIKSNAYTKATGRSAETGLTQNEQQVMDSIIENRKSELIEKNGKVTKKEVSQIEKDVRQDLERGYLDTNEIERALSTDEWNKHNEFVKRADDIKNKITELENTDFKTVGEFNSVNEKINSLKSELNNIDTNTTREALNNSMMSKLNDNDTLLHKSFDTAYNFNEKFEQSAKAHNIDTNDDTIKTIKKKMLKRGISASFDEQTFSDSKEDAIWRQNADGTREVIFNPKADTGMLLQNVAVHEMYHDVFSSKTGQKLNQEVLDYVKSKDGYEEARKELEQVYAKDYDINSEEFTKKIDEEVVAKTLGQKLGDQEYINSLTMEKPNTARAIYNWIVDKLNKFTGSKNEKLFWTDVKNKFETALSEDYVASESTTKHSKKLNGFYPEMEVDTSNINKFGIKNINDLTEVQDKVYDYYKNKYVSTENQSKPITNIDTGMKIEIWKRGIYETFGNKNYYKHLSQQEKIMKLATMDSLAKMIKYGEVRANPASNKHNPNSSAMYHYLEHPIIIDGTKYMVNMDIRKVPNTNGRFYIHSINTKKIGASKGFKTSRLTAPINNSNITQNQKNVNNGVVTKHSMQKSENNTRELDNSSFSLKQKQLEIINKNNPMQDDYHTGIRSVEDIRTPEEAFETDIDLDEDYTYPDFTQEDGKKALETGKITVYSSYPIEQGVFVSPSKMMAQDYAGENNVYSKEIDINNVAWINTDEGQYAKIEDSSTDTPISNKDSQGRTLTKEQQEYFKDSKAIDENGDLKVVYHGSKKAGFTTFKTKDNVSFYTDNNNVANTYSGSNEMVDTRKLESVSDAKSWLKGINNELYIDGNNVYDYDGEIVLEYENQNALLRNLKRDIQKEIGNTEAGGIYKGYVNITNPYVIDVQGKNWNDITIGKNDNVEKMYKSLSDQEKEYLTDLADKTDDMYDNFNDGLENFYQRLNANNETLYDKVTSENSIRQKLYQTALYDWNDTYVEDLIGKRYSTNDIVKQVLDQNKNGENYDGIIFENIVDEGMFDSGTKESTISNVYVTFNPNQFKASDNSTPTNDTDIRYSTTTDKFQEFLDKNIQRGKGKTIQEVTKQQEKAVKQAIAPLKQEIKTLKKEMSDLQENSSITQKEFEEQYKKIAPLLNEQVAPPEVESAPSIKDTSKMNTKDLKALSKNMKQQLGLTNKQKLDLENIIQEYSTSETATRNDLFKDIKDRFGKESITTEFEDIKNIQNELKNTKLDVSQNIKNDITDYNKLKQRNFGKIRFNRDGLPVDVVYQDLSSKYPNYFPSNIFNESDQFNKIVEVANLENKSVEEYNIDDDYLREASDFIYDSIEESKQDILKKLSEKERTKHLKSLLKDNNIIAPIRENNSNRINIEKIKKNINEYRPYIEMSKELNKNQTNSEVTSLLNEVDSKNTNTENIKTKPRKQGMIADAKRTAQYWFTNRNAEIDEYARETGNKNIKILADHVNNIQGEITTNINNAQTDNFGNVIGKSITQIFDQARQEKKSDAFNDYLFHKSNMARHKQGKGSLVDFNESEQLVKEYEKDNPEFKKWAKEVNDYNTNLLYKQAEAGLITKDLADNLTKIYDFYVPFFEDVEKDYSPNESGKIGTRSTIKSARGGADKNLLGFEEAMMRQTQSAITQIRKNQLYNEIIKTKANRSIDFENNTDPNIESGLQESGGKYYLTGYENGKATQVEIDKNLYHGLTQRGDKLIKQAEKKIRIVTKPLQVASNIRRNILTSWSPTFIITNPLKDLQDAPLNSKYAKDMVKNVPRAFKELTTGKGTELDAFLNMYGQANLRGDYNIDSGLADITKLAKTNKKASKNTDSISKKMLKKIPQMNEIIEMAPRYAEYLASIENGASQMEALYNAREVTTNFGRGGIITKALNRNGFTFLNASVQGFSKLVRNFSGENGGKAVLGCIAKASAFGLAPALINAILLGDDDDYEAIPDYIKDNYYLIKTSDDNFLRIPKGRMMSIFGSAGRRVLERTNGKRPELSLKEDVKGYLSNAYNQVGVQNPSESNIFAPIIQAKNNKTWYGTDLVPKRLQTDKDGREIPKSEQYDASTDKFSIWLGSKLGISPYKINYVVDQYSGGIGDMILPTITEEAQSKSDSVIGKAIAPLKDKFTADSVTDNKNVTNFYSKVEELGKIPAKNLSKKDEMSYQYMRNLSFEMGSLYKEMREVQSNTKMTDSKKYAKVQNIKAEINKIAEEGIKGYKDVEAYENYARVGDRELYKYKNKKGETGWSLSDSKYADDINTLGLSVKEKNDYYTTKMKMSDVASQYGENDGSKRYRAVIKTIKKSGLPSDAKYQLFNSWYGKNDKSSSVAQDVGISADDYLKYKTADLSADKNKNGYSIRGSKASKVINFLNKKTNLNKGQKAILYRMSFGYKGNYNSTNYSNMYNTDIVKYVNTLDTTYDEDVNIYKTLGFKVDKKGNIWW